VVEPPCKVKGPEPLCIVTVVPLIGRLEKSSETIDEVVDPVEIARRNKGLTVDITSVVSRNWL